MIPVSPRRRREQGGFALLMVFVIGAILAMSLYMQLPRAAFESQRAKEEMLIDRGKEYARAIQLYTLKNKRYPQSLDDLDKNTPQYHYLRHRYIDPMTGKDDWRQVHTNGTFLTDSKVQKPGQQGQGQPGQGALPGGLTDAKAANTFITEAAPIGSTGNQGGGTGAVNLATRRRESDNNPLPFPAGANPNPGQNLDPNAQPGQSVNPGAIPNATNPDGTPQGQPAGPSNNPNQQGQAGQPVQPPQPPLPGGMPNFPSGAQPGQPLGGSPFGGQQIGAGGAGQTAASIPGGAGSTTAAQMIGKLLTSPNPQAAAQFAGGGLAGGSMGGGIAGVASKFEGNSIKIVNERQKYDEWEFIYDQKKDPRLLNSGPQSGANAPKGTGLGGSAPTGTAPGSTDPMGTSAPASTPATTPGKGP